MADNSNVPGTRSIFESLDPQLAQLMDEIHDRLVAGESIDVDAYIQQAPSLAPAIRQHVTMMQAMLSIGDESVAEESPPLGTTSLKKIGEFSIVREIGRGGMGIVYEAEQPSMGRRVALKILPVAALADSKQLQRFKNEVRAAAALDHPNIVSVYSVNETDGLYYYAMQLIRGQNLWSVIRSLSGVQEQGRALDDDSIRQVVSAASVFGDDGSDDPTSFARSATTHEPDADRTHALETIAKANDSTVTNVKHATYYQNVASLGIQAARALQHAHELGIVHRDIKPANLLLDNHARLSITDFGLASIEANTGATATGDVIGTLRYMPPEQALGKTELIDHRADIYALGIMLYELLSLKPAFEGRNRQELLQNVTSKDPERLRRRQQAIPAELEAIVMKAIAKDRDERYPSAGEFADDLARFVANQPIRARRVSLLHRARKWTQRNAVLVTTALGLLLLAAILSSLILVNANQRERTLREQAELLLAEVERTAFILTPMYNRAPPYFATLANAYANLAILLAESRPAESRAAWGSAKHVWRAAVDVMPDIENYQSGLRPNIADLAWFQQQFPDDATDATDQSKEAKGVTLRTDSHFTGVYLLEAGFANEAVGRFEASLKQGPELQAFDWIYLAMAHQQLGNTAAAQSFYRQAYEWTDENQPVDKELQQLLDAFQLDTERESTHLESDPASRG